MPSEIESRIVSMIFDNKQFERNVATSQKTLEKLDEQLKFKDADKGFKGISDAASQVSFSSMISKVQDIGIKMKASSVIGIEVLKRLTNSAIDFAKTWASKVIEPITSGGWNRATAIDNAKFQLQGLGIAWDEISDDIDYGVRDTAYGLGAAAMAASQFAASGVELGDNMKTALRGISGVAAMTNSTYEDISGIFTGIAGANRVFADDLNSLAARGLNAAAQLTNYFNKIVEGDQETLDNASEHVIKAVQKITNGARINETQLRDFVSKGVIDFNMFAEAMDRTFGEHSKKGNETFEGSLANMKSALGRIGAEFAASYRAQMIPVWNALRITINDVKKTMGPVFETADAIMTDLSERFSSFIYTIDELVVKSGAFASIFEGAADIMEGVYEIFTTIVDTVSDAFTIIAPSFDKTLGLLENLDEFQNEWKLDKFRVPAKAFADMAKSFKEMVQSDDFIDKLITGVKTVLDIFSTLKSIVTGVFNVVKNIVTAFRDGFNSGTSDNVKSLLTIQGALEFVLGVLTRIERFVSNSVILTYAGKIPAVIKTIGSALGTLLTGFRNFSSAAIEAFDKIFHPIEKVQKTLSLTFGPFFSNIIESVRNAISKFGSDNGIYDAQVKHFETLFNIVKSVKKILGTVAQAVGVVVSNFVNLLAVAREAFYEIFDGGNASDFTKKLNQVIWSIQNFINKLLLSETALENFKRFFKGIFAVVDIAKSVFTTLFHIISSVFTNIMGDVTNNTEGAVDGLTGFLGRIGDILVKLRDWLEVNDVFEKVGTVISTVFSKVLNVIRAVVDWVTKAKDSFAAFVQRVTGSTIGEHFDKLKEKAKAAWEGIKGFFSGLASSSDVSTAEKRISPIQTIFDIIKKSISGVAGFLQKVWPVLEKIFTVIGDVITNLFSGLGNALSAIGTNSDGISGAAVGIVGGIAGIAGSINGITSNLGTVVESFTTPLNAMKEALEGIQEALVPSKLLKIAAAIGIMALSIVMLASVDVIRLTGAMIAMKALTKILKDFTVDLYSLADTIGMKGVKELKKVSTALLVLGAAVLVFAGAIKMLGGMDPVDILKGTVALYALMQMLVGFAKGLSKIEKSITKAAASMILLAIAMDLMVIPMKAFGKMEWEDIAKGLLAIAGLLLEFVVVTKVLEGSNAMMAAGTVLMLANALLLMTIPMKVFSTMEWEEIARGLVAVGGLLLEFVIVTKLLKGGNAMMAAGTMIMLSTALLMMTVPMKLFSKMEWEEIAKGLVAVGGLLLELSVATKLMKDSSAMMAAGTMIIMAAALNMLIIPLKTFGGMSWGEIGKGLLVIAGALAILIIAGMAAEPAAKGILVLSAALMMIGIATLAVGAGVLMLASGLKILSTIGPEIGDTIKAILTAILEMFPVFIRAIMDAISELVTGIVRLIGNLITSILMLFPQVIAGVFSLLGDILTSIVEFLPTLLEVFPVIVNAFFTMLTTIVSTFAEVAPKLFNSLGIILREFFRMLNDTAPTFFELVKTIILGVIDTIRETSPALIETLFEILLKTLEELAKNAADITALVLETILSILEVLTTKLPDISLKVVEFIIGLIDSVATTLMEKAPEIRDAIAKLLGSIIKLTLEIFGFDTSNMDENEFTNIGKFLMGGFVGGIANKFPEFWEKIKEFFKSIGEWFKQKFEDFKDWGKNIIESFVKGVKEKFENAKEKVTGFFSKIGNGVKDFFGIHSPSKMFSGFGQNVMEGFKNGVGDKLTTVTQKMSSVFKDVVAAVGDPQSSFTSIGANLMAGLQNGINSNVQNAINAVKGAVSNVVQGAKNLLGIRSPSRVFAEIGKYCDEGMAKGLNSYSDLVSMAGEDVANEAIMSTAKAMAMASEMATDATNQPTIRPVLDLTEIENGTSRIANMFGDPTLGLGTTGGYTYTDWSLGQIKMGSPTGTSEGSGSSIITNSPVVNFTINAAQGQNPEEIAAAVEKRLTKSFNQKGAAFR